MSNDYTKYGDFSPDGTEFIIARADTPRPWFNYAWNRSLVSKIDQRGRGRTMYRSEGGERTYLIQDRVVYLKDRRDHALWTVGWDPVRLDFSCYRCCHGLGYTRLETQYRQIRATLTITTSVQDPVELWEIRIQNTGSALQEITLYPYVEFELGGWVPYGTLETYSITKFEENTIYAINGSREREGIKNNCFMTADQPTAAWEVSKAKFWGKYGSLAAPQGLTDPKLRCGLSGNEDMVGVMQFDLDIQPGQEKVLHVVIGAFENPEDAKPLRDTYRQAGIFEKQMALVRERTRVFPNVDFTLPDPYLDVYFNIWTKQQLRLSIDYARLYMMGFRDTMQDALAFCALDPERTREALIKAMKHQYAEGSTLRAWWPTDTHKYADSGIWLVFTLSAYVKETGDFSFLEEKVPYYDHGEATVFEHARQALRWIYAEPGAHGLTKVFFGDWNDSLGIGKKGKGESVWLAMGLVWAQEHIIQLAEKAGDSRTVNEFTPVRNRLIENIQQHGWDGQWYRRGFTDEGEKVGSQECTEGKVFANPQTWAILAGLAKGREEQLEKVLQEFLMTDYGLLVTSPPFKSYRPSHGRITTVPPGGAENASSYCHVSAFKSVADCCRRDGDAALDTLSRILSNNPRNPIDRGGVEPFAMTNMYFGPDHARAGEGFWGWFSGTVGWVFRCVNQHMIGVRPEFDGLLIDPVLPSGWDKVTMKRRFRQAEYTITITNPHQRNGGKATIEIDGEPLEGNLIPYSKYHHKHTVKVQIV